LPPEVVFGIITLVEAQDTGSKYELQEMVFTDKAYRKGFNFIDRRLKAPIVRYYCGILGVSNILQVIHDELVGVRTGLICECVLNYQNMAWFNLLCPQYTV
jgi:hypothetical protein